MKALGVVLFSSVGAGYTALNMAGRMSDLEVLEFSPLGETAQILVLGELKKVNSYIVELRTGDILRSLCIADFDEGILRSYLSLDNAPISQFLLTVEGHFAGDLFQAASELKKRGFAIVDFRVFRATGSPGYVTLTGNDTSKANEWITEQRTKLATRQLQVTLLTDLSQGFRKYVDLEL